jgi:enoyl-CoA hydratase
MGVSTSLPDSGTDGGTDGGTDAGIAVVTVAYPPVNALPVSGWYALADALREAGRDERVRVVVLEAPGRGFNAGVDIKEIQRDPGPQALIGANRGCAEAFAAVYECQVPVIAAVQGFCLGGGIGLVGNADAIVAADDAYFGLPELDRGALGAATHLARLVPPHLMRPLYYTGRTVTARELHRHGSVWRVVPRAELRDSALELARQIAAKDGYLLRLAKEAINGIDPVDVRRSYRFEQGFTFEANLAGASDKRREAFLAAEED